MKVACNLKGAGMLGFSVNQGELHVLHDVYHAAVEPGADKATYEVQFLWRDLTSGYDLVGPHFPVPQSVDSNTLQELLMLSLKAFHSYGFKIAILLCDGASSNLSLLKILLGCQRAQLPSNDDANTLAGQFAVKASFVNPEDPNGPPLFVMICPSHQV